tara:strand:+ start:474 stop:635 length:162 start_codon:yes stop_codon:yes gene_type:complete
MAILVMITHNTNASYQPCPDTLPNLIASPADKSINAMNNNNNKDLSDDDDDNV